MALPDQLERLKCAALSEQQTAAEEGRVPDWQMLDRLGSVALAQEAAVPCEVPYAYYREYSHTLNVHNHSKVESPPPVGGRFGGFMPCEVDLGFDLEGKTPTHKVGYFIADNPKMISGHVCPVESSSLHDVVDILGTDDPTFDAIVDVLTEDKIDIVKLATIVRYLNPNDNRASLYSAYIKSALTPSDLFNWIECKRYMSYGFNGQKGEYSYSDLGMYINPSDTFVVNRFGTNQPELMIRKGRNPCLFVPITDIIGYEATKNLALPK